MNHPGTVLPRLSRRGFLAATAGAVAAGALEVPLMRAAVAANAQATAVATLRQRLKGRLLEPTDGDYLAWAVSANTRYDSVLPLAAALCETPEDVAACIAWAQAEGVPLAVRGGGHNYIGLSSTNGLLVVTRLMRKIEVDTATGVARIGAGAVNGEVFMRLRGGDWMLPVGTCPSVGVTGLTLGGGIGFNTRWAGLTSDHLTATSAVLAGGEPVDADAVANGDLFWAARGGGGGNFALHTELTFQLLPAPRREITYFELDFRGADASRRAYAAFDALLQEAPDALGAAAYLSSGPRPDEATTPVTERGAASYPSLEIYGAFIGGTDDLKDLLGTLLALRPGAQLFKPTDFWTVQGMLAEPPTLRHGFADVNRYANRAQTEAEVDEIIELLRTAPVGRSDRNVDFLLFGWVGGKVNRIAPAATAYPHRRATTLLRAGAVWDLGAPVYDQLAMLDWVDRANDFVRRVGEPASYVNWPSEKITDWPNAYYGENLQRLIEIKRAVDPDNRFRSAQSVPLQPI